MLTAVYYAAGVTFFVAGLWFLRQWEARRIIMMYMSFQTKVPYPYQASQSFLNKFQPKVEETLRSLMQGYVIYDPSCRGKITFYGRRVHRVSNETALSQSGRFWGAAKKYGFRVYSSPTDYVDEIYVVEGNHHRMVNRFNI